MRYFLLGCLLLLAACSSPSLEPPTALPTPTSEVVAIRVILEVAIANDEEALTATDAVFLGEVVAISPTHFNQDNGDYYDDAMGVHTVTFRVVETLFDDLGLGPEVTLTDLAGSPVDQGTVVFPPGRPIARYEISVSHKLDIGQRVVVLARRNAIVWRGGTREVLAFAVWAGDSVFYEDRQGLYRRNNSELPAMTYETLRATIRE